MANLVLSAPFRQAGLLDAIDLPALQQHGHLFRPGETGRAEALQRPLGAAPIVRPRLGAGALAPTAARERPAENPSAWSGHAREFAVDRARFLEAAVADRDHIEHRIEI